MDNWENVIEEYKNCNDITNLLKHAEQILHEELASFEIEWMVSCLLKEPVDLLRIINSKHREVECSKLIADSLKLLTDAVDKYSAFLEQYYEDIVQVCVLPHYSVPRQHALSCLSVVSKHSPLAAHDFLRHLASLEQASVCLAPLATLVGTICEYHPDVVVDEISKVWRVFLNLLDSNKLSSSARGAVLAGAGGVLRHFSEDLPTTELRTFGAHVLSASHLPRCRQVCIRLLSEHSDVFGSQACSDERVRGALWEAVRAGDAQRAEHAQRALLALYVALTGTSDTVRVQVRYTSVLIL
ncbi:unnamed protein product [Leptidea sinapis]|uniref:Uncharacterized protein n=1 Tax=Leptidea sinapis TaxID=189913 RepID=A0A5E4QPT9_9NEOP|nr:unnamed protein product [Leptidea sinapis]